MKWTQGNETESIVLFMAIAQYIAKKLSNGSFVNGGTFFFVNQYDL